MSVSSLLVLSCALDSGFASTSARMRSPWRLWYPISDVMSERLRLTEVVWKVYQGSQSLKPIGMSNKQGIPTKSPTTVRAMGMLRLEPIINC